MVHEGLSFKDISHLELWWPPCSAEQNYLENLVEGTMRDISVKLLYVWTSGLGRDVVKIFPLSTALAVILFGRLEPFRQLW